MRERAGGHARGGRSDGEADALELEDAMLETARIRRGGLRHLDAFAVEVARRLAGRALVKRIGCSGVPTAVRPPSTTSRTPSRNWTAIPASIVSLAPAFTVTRPVRTSGLFALVQAASAAMSPSKAARVSFPSC